MIRVMGKPVESVAHRRERHRQVRRSKATSENLAGGPGSTGRRGSESPDRDPVRTDHVHTETPGIQHGYRFRATVNVGAALQGVVPASSQAVASPGIPSWNQLVSWLQSLDGLREVGTAA